MCNVECDILLQVISFSWNEISVQTVAFMQQIWLYRYSSSNITYSHNCPFYVHSCDIMNYLTIWLFHVHNDNDISHITDVTISCATMVTS